MDIFLIIIKSVNFNQTPPNYTFPDLYSVREFKYLRTLFTNEGNMESEINRQFGAILPVMQ